MTAAMAERSRDAPAKPAVWAPVKFTVGKHYSGSAAALPSCRHPAINGWTQLSKFKAMTGGYAPGRQLDRAVELSKAVSGAVAEIENKPVAGFKLVQIQYNLRGWAQPNQVLAHARFANESAAFLIEDPRGFVVGVNARSLYSMLEAAGGRLDGWTFPVEAAYVWDDAHFAPRIVAANSAEWKAAWEESRAFEKAAAEQEWLKPNQFELGHVYIALKKPEKPGGQPQSEASFYLGESPVYSHFLRSQAILAGEYPTMKKFKKQSSRLSGYFWGMSKRLLQTRELSADKAKIFASVNGSPNSFWRTTSTARLFPADMQDCAVPAGNAALALGLLASGSFRKMAVSREAVLNVEWKQLQDPRVIADSAGACLMNAVTSEIVAYTRCAEAMATTWPMLPGCMLHHGGYLSAGRVAATQVLAVQDSVSGKLELASCNVWRESGKWCMSWRESIFMHERLEGLAELAVSKLKFAIPELKYLDGAPVPESEAAWFAAEVAEVQGLASFDWRVPVAGLC